MTVRSLVLWSLALAAGSPLPACSASPDASNPADSGDGAAPEGASGGGQDSGSATPSGDASSGGSSGGNSWDSGSGGSTGDSGSPGTPQDSGSPHHDSGSADGSGIAVDSGECIRPPFQTTNECTGIGMPGGPAIPSCSKFDANGKLICPTIPGCTVVPDPSGTYCTGDNVKCGLSDCGHICLLPNWEPCYDVATGECLEGC